MDDLIRKQTVLNMIDDVQFGNITHRLSQLHEAVRNYPTVDAVEVVRCKDCIYCSSDFRCSEIERNVDSDFFCEKGFRKPDEAD